MYFRHGSKHSKGVAILFNPLLEVLVENQICCDNGRILIMPFCIDDQKFTCANIHARMIMMRRKLYFLNNSDLYLNSFPATTI